MEKTLGKVKERFYWPGHFSDVQKWCNTCAVCAMRKTPVPRPKAKLCNISVGSPMELVAMDILGPLPETAAGNSYILVVGDYFTKWMEAYPIPNQEATTIASKLVNEFICRFSVPRQLHSDQGAQFESKVITEICKLLHIDKTRTTPYHPQSDGLIERFNRILIQMLATCADTHPLAGKTMSRRYAWPITSVSTLALNIHHFFSCLADRHSSPSTLCMGLHTKTVLYQNMQRTCTRHSPRHL